MNRRKIKDNLIICTTYGEDFKTRTMPNGNRRGGRDRGGHFYKGNEHDDRVPLPQDGTRRVFKNHNRQGKNRQKGHRQKGWDEKINRVLMDGDVDMSAGVRSNDRMNNYHHKLKRDGERWKNRTLPESVTSWYKIIVRNGHRYPKEYLLKLLGNFLKPHPFIPMGFKVSKDEISFAIDEHETALQLFNADRKITAQDGWKLVIRVRPYTPMVEIDPKLTAAMKAVMASRYNPAVKALNLKKFHADPALVSEELFVPLNRPNIMMAALDIIAESIPDLIALDLSDNKLNQTEHMKIMIEKCPQLKILHIGDNRLRDIKQLDPLKGLQLEELVLDGNSLCDKFTSQEIYIRDVRQRFPKVVRLDGIELPPPILFDVEDEGTLPVSQPSFMAAEGGAEMVRQFLQQYYQLYDSEGSREPLHQAYHESAQFSYDVFVQTNDQNYSSMTQYMSESRNLMRISNLDRRVRNLRVGKASIIEALNNLPKTKHDPTSFLVDLVVFTPQLIQLNVSGLFTEPDKKNVLRAFSRVFIIIPVNLGFCIVNDQLTISQPTQDQVKKVNQKKAEAAASLQPLMPPSAGIQPIMPVSPIPSGSPIVAPTVQSPAAVAAQPDVATKQQMVATLAMASGMNLPWSEKCLNETNWNYDQAMFAFTKLHKAGSIPAEAFIK